MNKYDSLLQCNVWTCFIIHQAKIVNLITSGGKKALLNKPSYMPKCKTWGKGFVYITNPKYEQ